MNINILALKLSESISFKNLQLFIDKGYTINKILNYSSERMERLKLVKRNKIYEGKEKLLKKAKEMINICRKLHIKIITIDCDNYPQVLKNIYMPPLVLYYRGTLPLFEHEKSPFVSVVGSRKSNDFMNDFTQNISERITEKGGHIISGLALGIDSYAHLGALKKGATTAVLGCGVDVVYPYVNRGLYQKILNNNGCILSEYPPTTRPLHYHFPQRNRIISGLCESIFMVQAPEKSGAMITVNYGLEQGKNIYTYKQENFYSTKLESYGGNIFLLKEGAIGISSVEELLKQLKFSQEEITIKSNPESTVKPIEEITIKSNPESTVKPIKEITIKSDPKSTVKPIKEITIKSNPKSTVKPIKEITIKSDPESSVKPIKEKVITFITNSPKSIDEINNKFPEIDIQELLSIISFLVLEGSIKEGNNSKFYCYKEKIKK